MQRREQRGSGGRRLYRAAACSAAAQNHAGNGVGIAAARLGAPAVTPKTHHRGFLLGVGIAAVALVLGVAAIGGLLYPIHDPSDNPYAEVYRRLLGARVPAAARQ